ncbi:MAG: hypothetical protein AB9869_22310 [Verrucomicrobiia bacterium]
MKNENRSTFFLRNARFLWLVALLIPPAAAFGAYHVTPHDEIWHEILYSLLCLPLFILWLVALLACVLTFAIHRSLAKS